MARSVGQTVRVRNRSSYIPITATALAAAAMVTQKGPIGEARRVDSWPEFERLYGGAIAGYIGAREARRALDGGCALLVSRVVHYDDLADPTSKTSAAAMVTVPDRSTTPGHGRVTGSGTFPFRLTHGDTLVVAINGGGNQTATFNGFARRLTGSGGTHATVTATHALVLVVNGVRRSVAFAGTENTAAVYAAAINAIPGISADVLTGNVRITTDKKGTGASLVVHADTDSDVLASLGFTSGQVAGSLGSSNVVDIEAVTAAEFTAIIADTIEDGAGGADADGHPYIESTSTGSGSSVQVRSSSTAEDDFGFDTTAHVGGATSSVDSLTFIAKDDGTHAHALRLVIDDAQSDPATRFRVRVTDAAGTVLQTHDNLSMSSSDPRYVVNVFSEESDSFRVTDEESATSAPNNRPLAGTYTPAGGDDGLVDLNDDDYLGDATTRTGLHAFDNEADFRLAAMIGVTSHTGHVAGTAWASGLTEVRYVGAIPYAITTKTNALAFRRRVSPYATGSAIDSDYGALYAGWCKVRDARTREVVWLSGIGEVFAALGAATREGGVWLPMAGQKRALLSTEVLELRIKLNVDEVESMRAGGVNPFYQEPSGPFYCEGQSTLAKTPSQLDRLNACLLIDFVSEQTRNHNRIDRHDPNDEELWRTIRERTNAFLEALSGKRGTFEKDAHGKGRFRVVCDHTNNTSGEIAAHRTHIDIACVPQGVSEEQEIGIDVFASGTDV
jgi:hypothetical protein